MVAQAPKLIAPPARGAGPCGRLQGGPALAGASNVPQRGHLLRCPPVAACGVGCGADGRGDLGGAAGTPALRCPYVAAQLLEAGARE
ncbi:unnamed protein product [Amoebophrya sp. A120]|nr:unnamed protein product [Amoebophrya sp. A120]|eukprot:GSA120T00015792001.1